MRRVLDTLYILCQGTAIVQSRPSNSILLEIQLCSSTWTTQDRRAVFKTLDNWLHDLLMSQLQFYLLGFAYPIY